MNLVADRMNVRSKINAPRERVWEILTDTLLWPEWGPSVSAVDSPERWIRSGLSGRVKTALGFWVPFEITDFKAPVFWHWRIAGIPATGHRLRKLDSDHCSLIFEIPYGAFPYAAVCRRAARRIARLAEQD